jgi:hypothetical protein
LNSLNDVSVTLFCSSLQVYAIGPPRLQYLYSISLLCIVRADLIPLSQYLFVYFRTHEMLTGTSRQAPFAPARDNSETSEKETTGDTQA